MARCAADEVEIVTAGLGANEEAVATELRALFRTFDLSPYLFTRKIRIARGEIPHSHPVLTLNTRHRGDRLLSVFLHEQIHWFVAARPAAEARACAACERLFPDLPVAPPDGAGDRRSTCLHVVINRLEHRALATLVGEERALAVTTFWAGDHYRAIYRLVLDRGPVIDRVLAEVGLDLANLHRAARS